MAKKSNYNIEWRFDKNLVPFVEALDFMQERVEKIVFGQEKQMVWVLEHEAVYTAGISAKDEDFIGQSDVPVFKTNRGGKYTYHCPGMKIIYVMLDLKEFFAPGKPDVARFVEFLENWVIAILANYKIKGEIRKGRVGIWVETPEGEKKIAALGIKIKKWVSYHGIAINIDPDLSGFQNIVPCGIKEFGVTSIKELGISVGKEFDEVVCRAYLETKTSFTRS